MVGSTESPAVEWWLGVPDGFPGRRAGPEGLFKARGAGASDASGRTVQMPLHVRKIVEPAI
jgi:hypothetical protein